VPPALPVPAVSVPVVPIPAVPAAPAPLVPPVAFALLLLLDAVSPVPRGPDEELPGLVLLALELLPAGVFCDLLSLSLRPQAETDNASAAAAAIQVYFMVGLPNRIRVTQRKCRAAVFGAQAACSAIIRSIA
jgi:hypothetical protein